MIVPCDGLTAFVSQTIRPNINLPPTNGRSEDIITTVSHHSPGEAEDAQAVYTARMSTFESARAAVHRRWNLIANIRLVVFVALGLAVWWLVSDRSQLPGLVVLLALVALIWLIVTHRRLRHERDRLDRLVHVNADALARLNLDWDAAPEPPAPGVDRRHPYAFDLDIVGHASLAHRIGTLATPDGWRTLSRWLLEPGPLAEVPRRQPAVRELAAKLALRQEVEAAGRAARGAMPDPEPLLSWAESTLRIAERPLIRFLAAASPVALILFSALQLLGVVPFPFWLIPLTLNVMIFLIAGAGIADTVARIAPMHQAIAGYRNVFALIAEDDYDAAPLRDIRALLGSGPAGATTQVSALTRISSLALPRGSILYYPAQMFLLWDAQVLRFLERWRRSSGTHVRKWLAAAGEWDAIAALSVLVHDHPDWAFASIDFTGETVAADELGHPLIPWQQMVRNDVAIGPAGTFLFVTGSNMSGKSTLLRAVGINAVLAMAGGPSCARSIALPPVDVRCCMRVEDSVTAGVSFFMAELRRLKGVVDAALVARERPVLYLLDEIMQGTNTAERQIASRAVLDQLTSANAIGAISSHDLGLLSGSPLDDRSTKAHFAEQFEDGRAGPEMTFDYRLRPGIATSTNALKLMEILGFHLGTSPLATRDDDTWERRGAIAKRG